MVTNFPLFRTRGILTFYIDIASYTIDHFSFFFYLFYTTCIYEVEGTIGSPFPITLRRLPIDTVGPYGHHFFLATFATFSLFFSFKETVHSRTVYGRGYGALLRGQVPWVGGGERAIMPRFFNNPIYHGSNQLHMATPPPWLRKTHPPGINLRMYVQYPGLPGIRPNPGHPGRSD